MVDKIEFITKIRQARETWVSKVLEPALDDAAQKGSLGGWILKDLLAHITWYEREMVEMLRRRNFNGSSLWELQLDERNARITSESQSLNLDQALAELNQVHKELLRQLELLDEEDLSNPASFPGMPIDWQPWQVIASNTYEHYLDHL